jgi:uncharacterized protein YndB with AHSA1/START domain
VPPRWIETDRALVVAAPPGRVWEVCDDVAAYPSFWPWLRAFDGRRLAAGERWAGVVHVAGPFRLPLVVVIAEVVDGRRVRAEVHGAIRGRATVELAPDDAGTLLRLTARLSPRPRSPLALATRLARPLAQASHDRVIARALAQLTAHVAPP